VDRPERGSADGIVVLAVDDEEPALATTTELLCEHPWVASVLQATDAAGALRLLRGGAAPEAVFTDIGMPDMSGIELARAVAELPSPPPVVFVTDHDNCAVDAYEIGVVDYLLKPVRPERLDLALARVFARRVARPLPLSPPEEIVPVELAGTTTLVPRSDVRFVEARGDYARLHTDTSTHLVRISLATLAERWREAGWVRIHRSYLVAADRVTAVELGSVGHVVRVGRGRDAVELPVSRRHVREVRARLGC
jgi:DNA-binding LytR/AlgR family response regulator